MTVADTSFAGNTGTAAPQLLDILSGKARYDSPSSQAQGESAATPGNDSGSSQPQLLDILSGKSRYAGPPAQTTQKPPGTLSDIGSSIASGVATGIENLPSLTAQVGNYAWKKLSQGGEAVYNKLADKPLTPQQEAGISAPPFDTRNIYDIAGNLAAKGAGKLYTAATGKELTPEQQAKLDATKVTAGPYQPQTTLGDYANTAAQFAIGGKAMGAAAIPTATAAATSETAGQVFKGTPYEEDARMAGGILGGGVASAADTGGRAYLKPVKQAGREQMLVDELDKASADPQALRDAVTNPTAPAIPGSQPTLQETVPNDAGIEQYQQKALADAAKSNNANLTDKIKNAQEARQAAFEQYGKAMSSGDPNEIGKTFTSHLNALEAEHNALDSQAEQLAGSVKGANSADQTGTAIYKQAKAQAAASKENYDTLWHSLDKYDPTAIDSSMHDEAINTVKTGLKGGDKLRPEEEELYNYSPPTFGDLRALNARYNTAIQMLGDKEGFQSPAVARLQQVKASIMPTLEQNLGGIAQREQQAVAAGQMALEQTFEKNIVNNVHNWYSSQNAGQSQAIAGGNARQSIQGSSAQRSGQKAFTRAFGAGESPTGRSGSASGSKGIPPEVPALDDTAKSTYEDYKKARTEHGNIFGSGAVGEILESGERPNQPAVPYGAVPSQFFHPGNESGQSIREYKAAGLDPKSLEDYALHQLNASPAINPVTGMLNEKGLATFTRRHQSALSELPDLKSKLTDLQKAQSAINDQAAKNSQSMKALKQSKAAAFLGEHDPAKAIQSVLGSNKSAAAAADIMERLKSNPDAVEGMKRLTLDHVFSKYGEVGKEQNLADYVKSNRMALKRILGGQGIQELDRAVADRASAVRALAGKPDGNTTVMGWLDRMKEQHPSLFAVGEAGAAIKGGEKLLHIAKDHPVTASITAIGLLANAFRRSGMSKLDDLRMEAIVNPNKLADIYKRIPANASPPVPVIRRIASQILSTVPMTAISANSQHGKNP